MVKKYVTDPVSGRFSLCFPLVAMAHTFPFSLRTALATAKDRPGRARLVFQRGARKTLPGSTGYSTRSAIEASNQQNL